MASPPTVRRASGRLRRLPWLLFGLAVFAAVGYGFLPQAIEVESGLVRRGTMRVTVVEDGKTRVRERYTVSSPVTGHVDRIHLKAGDEILGGQSLLTTITPSDPELLNPRTVVEITSRVKGAERAVERATVAITMAQVQKEVADKAFERTKRMAEKNGTTAEQFDRLESQARVRGEELRSAQLSLEMAQAELEWNRAALEWSRPKPQSAGDQPPHIDLYAPISGRVLRVLQESDAVLSAGTKLLEIGDPHDLEVVIDVLSADACKITPGQLVLLENWGGPTVLNARVRRVEPSGFTKLSALGVEEQRVNVLAELDSDALQPGSAGASLGDGYRVETQIVIWEGQDKVLVPASACFRNGDAWNVYVIENGRARRRSVQIGQRNAETAEVLEGLTPDQRVILHPGDNLAAGSSVVLRGLKKPE